jgi:hypothetical protein
VKIAFSVRHVLLSVQIELRQKKKAVGKPWAFVLDTTLRTPTTASYLKSRRSNAANTAGFAAALGGDSKMQHHQGLIPMVQESYGRIGIQAAVFVTQLAAHSAACKGGSTSQILRRRGVIHASIRTQLSAALAREVSERVFAYIRGARRFYGRKVDPVSGYCRQALSCLVSSIML